LDEWTAPINASKPIIFATDTAQVIHEPLGVVLVIAAWNYPWFESIIPMVSAIAAGNCVIIKVRFVSRDKLKL
jgi:aldehyde dehydrogenase (NAD+)